jgi:NADH-quinone oxidoreductase subunit J
MLYTACVIGAAGLYLVLKPGRPSAKAIGALLGLGAFGWLLVSAANAIGGGSPQNPQVAFTIASGIAILAAGRMVTHTRPVYCALYFILVVLSSAALFLLLEAEFIAFALVIVYAGAILITYMFVLMLAQQAGDAAQPAGRAEYDVVPREPAAATLVGFVLLAVLSNMIVIGAETMPAPSTAVRANEQAWLELEQMPARLQTEVRRAYPQFDWPPDRNPDGSFIAVAEGRAYVTGHLEGSSQTQRFELPPEAMPENIQRVGWALVAKFPASLELAGVILLMAMVGAVVLARRQIELGEDEKRLAAGMRRLTVEDAAAGEGATR